MTAIYYNPAGLANFKNINLFGWQHSNWLLGLIPDAYYEFVSYTFSTRRGVIGIGLTYLTIGEVEIQDEIGNSYKFTPYDVALSIGFGTELLKNLKVGGAVKYYYSFLIPEDVIRRVFGVEGKGTAQVPALDLGILYHAYKDLNIGVSLQNLGPPIRYSGNDAPEPLPLTLRLGLGYYKKFGNSSIRISGDIVKVLVNVFEDYRDSGLVWVLNEAFKHGGIELGIANIIFLRAGYFYDYFGDRIGPTFGIGARYKNLIIDVSDDRMIYRFNKEGESKPNIRFQLSYESEKKIQTDTIPKFIVEVYDSLNNKINNFLVEIYDTSWSSKISDFEGSNGKAIIKIPYGIYNLKISSRDYFEKKDKIIFKKNNTKIRYTLYEKKKAYVKIEIFDSLRNRNAFAKIIIDTIEKETTNISFEIPEGIYALKVNSIEYEDYYKLFEFKGDSSYDIKVSLKPRLAYINFNLNKKANVEIYKDSLLLNNFEDSTKLIKLPLGDYKFLISCENCPKMLINYNLSEIKDTTLNIEIPEYNQIFEFSNVDEVISFINKFPDENFIIEYLGPKPLNFESLKNYELKYKKSKDIKFIVSFKNEKGG